MVGQWWVTNSLKLVFTHPTKLRRPERVVRRVGQVASLNALAPLTPTHQLLQIKLNGRSGKIDPAMVGHKLAEARFHPPYNWPTPLALAGLRD